MAITKEDLRETESNIYKETNFFEDPIQHIITEEDVHDPGRITILYDLPFDTWPLILRYNVIVDPIDQMIPGNILFIPTIRELRRLKE
jgi:hypothetical protein